MPSDRTAHRACALMFMLATVALLSGCTGDGAGQDANGANGPGGSSTDPGTDGPAPGEGVGGRLGVGVAPLWFPGLEWTYTVTYAAGTVQGTIDVIVATETADTFMLTSRADDALLVWATHFGFPTLGSVAARTFVHDTARGALDIFDFPIEDNETWQGTTLDGRNIDYAATRTTTTIDNIGSMDAFEVTGAVDGGNWIRYVYSSQAGGLVEMDLDDDLDAVLDASIRLTDARASGDMAGLTTFEPMQLASYDATGSESNADPVESFAVDASHSVLYVAWRMHGNTGHYQGAITTPDGTTYNQTWTNTDAAEAKRWLGGPLPATEGSGSMGTFIIGQGSVAGDLYAVVRAALDES